MEKCRDRRIRIRRNIVRGDNKRRPAIEERENDVNEHEHEVVDKVFPPVGIL